MQPYINWEEMPFLRLLMPFLGGIGLAIVFRAQLGILPYVILLIWLLLALLHNLKKWQQSYQSQWWFGVLMCVMLVVCGFTLTQQSRQIDQSQHFGHYLTDSSFVIIRLNEPPVTKPNSLKAEVSVLEVHNGKTVTPTNGKALVYFEKDSMFSTLKYGSILLAKAGLKEVTPPKNPGEFNFKRYLSYQQIYHQAYLKAELCRILPITQTNFLLAFVYNMRTYLIGAIGKYIKSPNEQGVAMALLLGYTQFLQDELQETYSHTGTIHVLAVSGLHVGIIYAFVNLLLGFLDKRGRRGVMVKITIVLLIIWLYAFITGLPPSVSRAAGMFSLFALAQVFSRHTNFYNVLAAAAFTMLLLDPFLVTRIGFQLSYIAVAGIVFYQPLIYAWFNIKNAFLDKVWQVSSVTLAAQLATLPLTLYYFNQFPTYFLFANLLTVPLAGILLPLGFIFFIFSPVSFIAGVLAWVLEWLFKGLNTYLFWVKQLPFSVIQGLSISGLEALLFYCLLAAFTIFFLFKQSAYLSLALGSLLLLCAAWAVAKYNHLQHKEICVYQYKNGTAIEFIQGYNSVVLADSAGLALFTKPEGNAAGRPVIKKRQYLDLQKLQTQNAPYNTQPDLLFPDKLFVQLPFVQFYDKRLVVLHDSTYYCPAQANNQKMRVNYLLLTQNCPVPLTAIQACMQVDTIVSDGSNKYWRTQKWTTFADSLRLPLYNTQVQGALVKRF